MKKGSSRSGALRAMLSLGVALGCAASVLAYAAIRMIERELFLEPNPAMLIWADHDPFAWRVALALYVGGAGAFGGVALASRSPAAAARGLVALMGAALVAVVVQGVIWP